MNKLARFNGWQRLGVVIAAATCLYALGWALVVGGELYRVEDKVLEGFRNPKCSAVVEMPAGGTLKFDTSYINPCFDLYLYRSFHKNAAQTDTGYTHQQNILLLQFVGRAFIAWLVAISLLYGMGVISAWIIRGFRPRE